MWVHFRRAWIWMRDNDALLQGHYKVYLKAQFHYAPHRDREKVWPTMLYNHKATQKWKWYLEHKKRRLGGVIPGILDYEKDLSTNRLRSVFEQASWDLEGFIRGGFDEDEALRAFESAFDPLFILASTGACKRLEQNEDYYGPRVREVYAHLRLKTKALNRLRILYGETREEQHRNWRRRLAL